MAVSRRAASRTLREASAHEARSGAAAQHASSAPVSDGYSEVIIDNGKVATRRCQLTADSAVGQAVDSMFGSLRRSGHPLLVVCVPSTSVGTLRTIGAAARIAIEDGLTEGKAWAAAVGGGAPAQPWQPRSVACAIELFKQRPESRQAALVVCCSGDGPVLTDVTLVRD